MCLEGERACPHEDVGGTHGHRYYLEAMAAAEHGERESFMGWRGPFDPEVFRVRNGSVIASPGAETGVLA